ncbi:DUF1638 domain-containing protein [Verrucomicrobiota bacterium]
MERKRLRVIACNVMWREICYHAALSPNECGLLFMPWGLHEEPDRLRVRLQQEIDATEPGFDAIVLGYGLCSRGVEHIAARETRLVITRGHDCITCFLGSRRRFQEYFESQPGTYWYTPGWIENHTAPGRERFEKIYRQYLDKYGEDNARYLMEIEQDWIRKYTTAAYVDVGIGDTRAYEEYTRRCAEWLKWRFERLEGDARLIQRMVNGDWDDETFLVVEPGHMIEATNDESIMRAVPARDVPDQAVE